MPVLLSTDEYREYIRAPRDRHDGIQHREGILQAAGNIVGVKNATWLAFFSPSAPIMRMYIQRLAG